PSVARDTRLVIEGAVDEVGVDVVGQLDEPIIDGAGHDAVRVVVWPSRACDRFAGGEEYRVFVLFDDTLDRELDRGTALLPTDRSDDRLDTRWAPATMCRGDRSGLDHAEYGWNIDGRDLTVHVVVQRANLL